MPPVKEQQRSRELTQRERARLKGIRTRMQGLRRDHGEDIETGQFVRVALGELVKDTEFLLNLLEGKANPDEGDVPLEGELVENDDDV